ncbi:hypothetical protein OG357_20545 [Streptomyces sp. NBC_01255]|uniref:hypothetical protein n=1 Tax=Streptomyces sp. NBC_01255 TaxID=2903798 RepID=UPI002E380FBC|nr:hypothetical protein [Streptomyces sp. NBC_01255]
MPEWVDGEGRGRGLSRRSVLRTAGALLPGLVLGVGVGAVGTASAASPPRTSGDADVRGTFSSPGYAWRATGAPGPSGAPATGVLFTLAAPDGRPLSGRRVRFSLGSFHAARPGLWFEVSEGRKSPGRHGYLDLDTDAEGTVDLAPWLRHGAVPTAATTGARPVVRAQLVGSETILATADLSVLTSPATPNGLQRGAS